MRYIRFFGLLVWLPFAGSLEAATVAIPKTVEIKAGRLGRIEATSETPVRWLNLHADLDLIEDSSGKVAIVLGSKPGTYRVAAYTGDADGPSAPSYCDVVVTGSVPPVPVPPLPVPVPPVPIPKAQPEKALLKIRFGSSGCTATIVGPQRKDGRWDCLTAAHCTGAVGTVGEATMQDGRKFKVTVRVRDTKADLVWLLGDIQDSDLPFAELATSEPDIGTAVWHAGYGVDRPGNRESGKVIGKGNSAGQLNFLLSVSPGDSGGGIFREDNGQLLSAVCCTAGLARLASMWGGSCVVAQRLRGGVSIVHPILDFQNSDWPD